MREQDRKWMRDEFTTLSDIPWENSQGEPDIDYVWWLEAEVFVLRKLLSDATDASESYKEQLQNSYLKEGQNTNREFMG